MNDSTTAVAEGRQEMNCPARIRRKLDAKWREAAPTKAQACPVLDRLRKGTRDLRPALASSWRCAQKLNSTCAQSFWVSTWPALPAGALPS